MIANSTMSRRRVEAEQSAVLDLQFFILDILRENGISKEELARRLNVSKARISQLFAADANPTVRQIARIYDALDHAFAPLAAPLYPEAQVARNGLWQQDFQPKATEAEMVYRRVLDAANENYAECRAVAA